MTVAERSYVVRFVCDCGFYAKNEEASFPESHAMGMQQKGVAVVLGLADEVAAPRKAAHSDIAALVEADDTSKRQRARV